MLRKDLDALEARDIQQLVTDKISETLTLEFKRQLNIASQKDKEEAAKDVSGMANSAGGFIVYGIDEQDRIATAVCPMNEENQIERLDQVLVASVSPRPTYRLRWIDVGGGGVLVVRVWPSDTELHMVNAKNRYYKRTETGVHPMTSVEVEAAFERIFRLRNEFSKKIDRILADQCLPRDGKNFGVVVVPLSSGDDSVDFSKFMPASAAAPDMLNYRGKWMHANPCDMVPCEYGFQSFYGGKEDYCVIRILRDGSVFFATSDIVTKDRYGEDYFIAERVILYCINSCRMARHLWPQLGIRGTSKAVAWINIPIQVIWGNWPTRRYSLGPLPHRRYELTFGANGPDDGCMFAKMVLDRLFQAMGLKQNPYIDENGQFTEEGSEAMGIRK